MDSNLLSVSHKQNNGSAFFFRAVKSPAPDPAAEDRVIVGFAAPAENPAHERLNLNEHLLRHPLATFFVRVCGNSMAGEKIYDGALLVIDRAEESRHGQIVLAVVNGEFCVRRLALSDGAVRLCAADPDYPDIELTPEDQWEIWGRVIYSINQH